MLTQSELEKFEDDGFLVLSNLVTKEDANILRQDCLQLVTDMNPNEHNTTFSTTKQLHRNDYFVNSADKIGYFFEDGAKDKDGTLLYEKQNSLNKIGHALHILCPNFKRITFSEKIKGIVRSLSFEEPTVCQSMYIFKPPHIGGKVVPHQDSTFLWVEPLKLVGIWIALEDATVENGCLWFVPGSHKDGLINGRRMVRSKKPDGPLFVFTGPDDYTAYEDKYIPVPINKGDAILINGTVLHKSEQNSSDSSRHIYTFHIFDQNKAKWAEDNWLQPTDAGAFTPLYATKS